MSRPFCLNHCTGRLTLTPSPHSWQMNASMTVKPRNTLVAPQGEHGALHISADASSINLVPGAVEGNRIDHGDRKSCKHAGRSSNPKLQTHGREKNAKTGGCFSQCAWSTSRLCATGSASTRTTARTLRARSGSTLFLISASGRTSFGPRQSRCAA